MKLAIFFAFLIGILLTADVTLTGESRIHTTFDRYFREHHGKETAAYRDLAFRDTRDSAWREANTKPAWFNADEDRKAREEGKRAIEEADKELWRLRLDFDMHRHCPTIGFVFLGCVLIWLGAASTVRSATVRGTAAFDALRGSIIGAAIVGTLLTCVKGVADLFSKHEIDRTFDRYQWEVRWLFAATLGAILGTIIGLIVRAVRARIRKGQNTA